MVDKKEKKKKEIIYYSFIIDYIFNIDCQLLQKLINFKKFYNLHNIMSEIVR